MIRSMLRCLPLLAALLAPVHAGKAATAVYSFGDSLSDTGNAFIGSGGTVPPAPYFAGRFSNGPIWVDALGAALQTGSATPFLLGGTNYAIGGANALGAGQTDLSAQIGAYLGGPRSPAPDGALFTLWAGSNDLLQALANNPGAVFTVAQQAAQAVVAAAGTLATIGGADEFLVLTLPDLGLTPRLLSSPVQGAAALATAASALFNATLLSGLASSAALASVQVHVLDVFTLIGDAAANPAAYGFSNVTDACLTANAICGLTQAAQDAYLFWDSIHPTSAAHAIIAQAALATIPEPAAILLFGLALGLMAAMAACGRRSRPDGAGAVSRV